MVSTEPAAVQTYQYNPFNRLNNAGGATNYVSPEGQRLRKSGGSTGTSYFAPNLDGQLESEYTNGAWVDYVRLNDQLIGRIAGGQVYAVHDDQVGRPEAVTNASGAVVWRARNFAFDSTVVQNSIGGFNLGFPGQYYDAETGLWNNGFRDYGAVFGRYVESDPIGLAGGVNMYAYVGNNPISYADPLGLIGYLCKKGNSVGIAIPINFVGRGTQDDQDRMAASIASAWSGQFGKYSVSTTVLSVSGSNSAVNTVHMVTGSQGADGKLSRVFGGQFGVWFTQASRSGGLDYAHEAGHLLGLGEETDSHTLMDDYSTGNSPTESDIDQALHDQGNVIGCGCDK